MEVRTIKFRAWYEQSQTWVYFTFNQPMTDVANAIHQNICINGGKFYQFTGLTDKNGVDIYEGDIFSSEPFRYVVVWENGAFYLKHTDKTLGNWGLLSRLIHPLEHYKDFSESTFLIGNIYENPNFLNQ